MDSAPGSRQPVIYGHRGASATHPENTIAAFDAALRLGVGGIELDIRATSDGVPVVSHDGTLRRIFAIDAAIHDLALDELRRLAPSIPTFAEVLALVDGRCHIDIEIKETNVEEAVMGQLADQAADRWAISSFDWDILRQIRLLS